jgi:hypothetical protein
VTAIDLAAPQVEAFLEHYGVKGMRWGIRREPQPGDSTETKAERKAAKKAVNDYMWNAIGDQPMFREMKKEEYDALCQEGQTFAKGIVLKRISFDEKARMEGATYVSKLKEDAEFYKASLPAVGPQVEGFGSGGRKRYKQSSYEVTMQTTKKLSLPSDKERFEAFYDLLGTPSIKMKGKKAPITGREYLEKQLGYKTIFRKQTDQRLAFRAYHEFVQGQGNKDNPINKPYFDSLAKKGYNALIDENDAGTYTKNPLILLDPKGTVRITNIHKLTADEINKAQRSLAGVKPPGAAK